VQDIFPGGRKWLLYEFFPAAIGKPAKQYISTPHNEYVNSFIIMDNPIGNTTQDCG
jgi:hypothetical protein